MCLALRLLVVLLLFPLSTLLFLVTIIIGTICNKVTSLTAFEAGALPTCLTLGGIFFASFECGLQALDDKRHFIIVEPDSLYLCYLTW